MVEVILSEVTQTSVFLQDMDGSKLPIAVARGEGRTVFESPQQVEAAVSRGLIAMRYVDSDGKSTEVYPLNPSGSTYRGDNWRTDS